MVIDIRNSATSWDVETDILVAGSGGAGLTAALTAADRQLQVTVLEKSEELGGTTAMSGGSIVAAGSPLQEAAGIEDDPEQLVTDLLKKSHGECPPEQAETIAEESGRTVEWIIDDLGWNMTVNTGPYGRIGHQTFRRHWLQDSDGEIMRDGGFLVDKLSARAREQGVELLTETPVTDLVRDGERIVGVVAGKDRNEYIRAGAVLLASGGFGANPELRRRHCPKAEGLLFAGTETNDGDSVRWGEELDASMVNMTGFLATGSYTYPESVHYPWALSKEGAFAVNENGEEFIDVRSASYSGFAAAMIDQPDGFGYLLFDQYALDKMLDDPSVTYIDECMEEDVFESGGTIGAVAADLNLDPETVTATFRDVNRARHRKLHPPFYGTAVQPALNITQGGLETDTNGAVLRTDGDPIRGLYAGGAAAVGLSGAQPDGYLSGNGLLHALNSGRIMGRFAADRLTE
jgi:fumarate reductase flavoprotein subunit